MAARGRVCLSVYVPVTLADSLERPESSGARLSPPPSVIPDVPVGFCSKTLLALIPALKVKYNI